MISHKGFPGLCVCSRLGVVPTAPLRVRLIKPLLIEEKEPLKIESLFIRYFLRNITKKSFSFLRSCPRSTLHTVYTY